MRAYKSLRELILGNGASLVEEQSRPETFGSAYAVFAGPRGTKFRLVWDGKENCGFLQSHVSGEIWKDSGPIVRERFGGKISNLKEFLATANSLM